MTAPLLPGANASLAGFDYQLSTTIAPGSGVQFSASLLQANGKVASASDFVCAAQTSSNSGAVQLNGEQFSIALGNLGTGIEKVVIAASLNAGAKVSQLSDIRVTVASGSGVELTAEIPVSGLSLASVLLGEFYLRNGQWKFRCVGQGFTGGLQQVASVYGTQAPTAPSPSPTPQPASPPPPRQTSGSMGGQTARQAAAQAAGQANSTPPPASADPWTGANSDTVGSSPTTSRSSDRGQSARQQTAQDTREEAREMMNRARERSGELADRTREGSKKALSWLRGRSGEARQRLSEETRKFRHKEFMDAVVAGCAMVAAADGDVSSVEKQKMIGFIETSDELSVFNLDDVIASFNSVVNKFDFDHGIGQAEALKVISRIKNNDEAARLMIRLCCAIGAADDDFDADEQEAVRRICIELGQAPEDFDL